jgi:hypothetical protein
MEEKLKSLLAEIDKCYLLADKELLEKEKLVAVELNVRAILEEVIKTLDEEILFLQFKKLNNNGWRTELKSGFHNISTAHAKLEVWRIFTKDVLDYLKSNSRTLKNRLESEGLFIESRSKEGGDLHLIIGQRDGGAEKAHAVVDAKTAEIRVEDNQIEPLDLVQKLESIITLPNGKKIRVTRESIEELEDRV